MPRVPKAKEQAGVRFFRASAPKVGKAVLGRGLQTIAKGVQDIAIVSQGHNKRIKAAKEAAQISLASQDINEFLIEKDHAQRKAGGDGTDDLRDLETSYDEFFNDNIRSKYSGEIIERVEARGATLLNGQRNTTLSNARKKESDFMKGTLSATTDRYVNSVFLDPDSIAINSVEMQGVLSETLVALDQSPEQINTNILAQRKRMSMAAIQGLVSKNRHDDAMQFAKSAGAKMFTPKELQKAVADITAKKTDFMEDTFVNQQRKEKIFKTELKATREAQFLNYSIKIDSEDDPMKRRELMDEARVSLGKGLLSLEQWKNITKQTTTVDAQYDDLTNMQLDLEFGSKGTTEEHKAATLGYMMGGQLSRAAGAKRMRRIMDSEAASARSNLGSTGIYKTVLEPIVFGTTIEKAIDLDREKLRKYSNIYTRAEEMAMENGTPRHIAVWKAAQEFMPGVKALPIAPGIPEEQQSDKASISSAIRREMGFIKLSGKSASPKAMDKLRKLKNRYDAIEREEQQKQADDFLKSKNIDIEAVLPGVNFREDLPGQSADTETIIPFRPGA